MFFNPKAALAEIEKQGATPATSATSATLCIKSPQKVADVADVAAPLPNISKSGPRDKVTENVAKVAGGDRHFPKTDMRHGFAANGDPKTWTGKIIPLDAWPNLTEWDRHGPNGRLYCGVCQQWVAECLHTGK